MTIEYLHTADSIFFKQYLTKNFSRLSAIRSGGGNKYIMRHENNKLRGYNDDINKIKYIANYFNVTHQHIISVLADAALQAIADIEKDKKLEKFQILLEEQERRREYTKRTGKKYYAKKKKNNSKKRTNSKKMLSKTK